MVEAIDELCTVNNMNNVFKEYKVQFNTHIAIDYNYYSVPYKYLGKYVCIREWDRNIDIYVEGKVICTHVKLRGRNKYSTKAEHLPKKDEAIMVWNGNRFRNWAKAIGPATLTVIDNVLKCTEYEHQAYKAAMAILTLTKKYTIDEVENGCKEALNYNLIPKSRYIKSIIEHTKKNVNHS